MDDHTHTCGGCAASFTSQYPDSVYCSAGCRNRAKQRRQRQRQDKPVRSECAFCAHPFTVELPARRFCYSCLPAHAESSRSDYGKRYNDLSRATDPDGTPVASKLPPWPKPRTCLDCGTVDGMDWNAHHKGKRARRCRDCYNLDCQRRDRQEKDQDYGTFAECVWCFQSFDFSSERPCCSLGCSSARDRHWLTWRSPNTCAVPQCIDCACLIPLLSQGRRCVACQFNFDANRRNATQARRQRAERAGDAGIHWRTLGDRDNWTCHLCDKRVPKSPGDSRRMDGATIDHLLPISLGGEHTWSNVKLAHRSCNLSRGNRGTVQLMLVG